MAKLLLPEKINNRLQHLGFQNDYSAMEMGREVHLLFEHYLVELNEEWKLIDPNTRGEITPGDVYREAAKSAMKPIPSMRDYHYTARNVSPDLELEFHMLGRHHWKALIPRCSKVGYKLWEVANQGDLAEWAYRILEWADDYGGQIISVAALRDKLSSDGDGASPMWSKRYKRAYKLCKLLAEDAECPGHLRSAAEAFRRASVPLP